MQYRYRMQSLKTGWGVEAEPTDEGKRNLERLRRKDKTRFKFCRIYLVKQVLPFHHNLYEPFRLTSLREMLHG